jgi:predicted small metal-binding protein
MRQIWHAYCLDCDWTASTHSSAALSSRLLDHALESGHDVDSITPDEPTDLPHPPTDHTIDLMRN